MAALPAGWIDTGDTVSHTLSLTVSIASTALDSQPVGVEGNSFFQLFDINTLQNGANTELYVLRFDETFEERETVATAPSSPASWLPVAVSKTAGPFRVGAALDYNTGTETWTERFALFADENTVTTWSVGGKSYMEVGGTLAVGPLTSVDLNLFIKSSPYGPAATINPGIRISNRTVDGVLHPTAPTLDFALTYYTFGVGAVPAHLSSTLYPPMRWAATVDVRDAAGAQPAGSVLVGPDSVSVANGGSTTQVDWDWGGRYFVPALLTGDWSSGGVTPQEDWLVVRGMMPKDPATPGTWTPISFTVNSPRPVLLSSNSWVGAAGAVVSGSGGSTWTVGTAGAAVSRSLLSYWRNWNTSGDPKYHADDGYRTTKHDYYGADGQDRWGWGLYAYLDVTLTAPASSTLTLTVTWATGGFRTYHVAVNSGTATYRVDLLFPVEGGPFHDERVDALSFSGLQVGVYTLGAVELVASEQAYVKVCHTGTPGIVMSQDGQFCMAHFGTNPQLNPLRDDNLDGVWDGYKDDEDGQFVTDTGLTSLGGCIDLSGTLQQAAEEWHRMEGMTVTYSGAALDAALTDGANAIGLVDGVASPVAPRAAWLHPNLPHVRATKNTAYSLTASPLADQVELCTGPAGRFTIPFHLQLGTVLEAQTRTTAGGRGPSGATVTAKRNSSGVPAAADTVMATATTDASGFVTLPIRNGRVAGARFYAYLEG